VSEASGPIQLSSADFSHGGSIPRTHSCDGENLSPALAWEGVPIERRSMALVCDDPDAPRGTWVHWVLYNLPGETVELSRSPRPARASIWRPPGPERLGGDRL